MFHVSRYFVFKNLKKFFDHSFHLDQRLVLALRRSHVPSARQFKYLPHLLGKRERRALLLFTLIFVISATFLGSRFYFSHRIFVPALGGEYSEALIGSPRNINPIFASANDIDADLTHLIYSGLLRYDGAGNLVPELAEHYEISSDFLTYTFILRDGISWHDGAPFSVDDVLFTIGSIQDSGWKSPLAVSFAGVKVEKVDDHTIRFVLKEPFAPFLGALTLGILPKHLWGSVSSSSARLHELNIKPVGTGPFRFRSFVRARDGSFRSYTLERNENFYGKKPYLERLIFRFYSDYDSAISALDNRAVMGLQYLAVGASDSSLAQSSDSFSGGVDKNPEIEYYKLKLPQYTALFLNLKKSDILAEAGVRKALALGLDRDRILREAIQNEGTLISSPILEGFLGYNSAISSQPFNPVESSQLLESLGWKLTATDTVRKKKTNNLSLQLVTVDRSEHRASAAVVAENWKALGVNVKVEYISGTNIQNDIIRNRNYDVLLYGEILGIEPDPYPFWHSSQSDDPGLNLSGFINRDADKLLEEARTQGSSTERAARYRAFQEILSKEIPAIFLYSPYYIYPQWREVKGFNVKLISTPSDRFSNIEEWHVKTKRAFK